MRIKMSSVEVLKQVAEGKISAEDAHKLLNTKKLRLKVSTKGAVQLDGLRRFPVTLYAAEWEQVLAMTDEIKKFIVDNKTQLTEKGKEE
jgi:hypothetical protein